MRIADVSFVGPAGSDDPFAHAPTASNLGNTNWGSAPEPYIQAGMIVARALASHTRTSAGQGRFPNFSGCFGTRKQFQEPSIMKKCGVKTRPSAFHRGWDIVWGNLGELSVGTPVSMPFSGRLMHTYLSNKKLYDHGCWVQLERPDGPLPHLSLTYHHINPSYQPYDTARRPIDLQAQATLGTIAPHPNGAHLHLELQIMKQAGDLYSTLPAAGISDSFYTGRISPWYIWGWEYWAMLPPRIKYNLFYLSEINLSPPGVLHIAAFAHILRGNIKRFNSPTLTSLHKAAMTFIKAACIRIDANSTIMAMIDQYPISDKPAKSSRTPDIWNPRVSLVTSERLRSVREPPGYRWIQDNHRTAEQAQPDTFNRYEPVLDCFLWSLVASNVDATNTSYAVPPPTIDYGDFLSINIAPQVPPKTAPRPINAFNPLTGNVCVVRTDQDAVTAVFATEFQSDYEDYITEMSTDDDDDPRGTADPYTVVRSRR